MKLLNNFLSATALAATSEALAFGAAHGLDLAMMVDVLNVSTGRNSATVDKFPEPGAHRHLRRRLPHRAHGEGPAPLRRDGGAPGTAREVGRTVSAVWQDADAALPGSDFTQIWQHISKKGRT